MRNFLAFTGFGAGRRPYFRVRFKRSAERRFCRVVQSADNRIRLYTGNTLGSFGLRDGILHPESPKIPLRVSARRECSQSFSADVPVNETVCCSDGKLVLNLRRTFSDFAITKTRRFVLRISVRPGFIYRCIRSVTNDPREELILRKPIVAAPDRISNSGKTPRERIILS